MIPEIDEETFLSGVRENFFHYMQTTEGISIISTVTPGQESEHRFLESTFMGIKIRNLISSIRDIIRVNHTPIRRAESNPSSNSAQIEDAVDATVDHTPETTNNLAPPLETTRRSGGIFSPDPSSMTFNLPLISPLRNDNISGRRDSHFSLFHRENIRGLRAVSRQFTFCADIENIFYLSEGAEMAIAYSSENDAVLLQNREGIMLTVSSLLSPTSNPLERLYCFKLKPLRHNSQVSDEIHLTGGISYRGTGLDASERLTLLNSLIRSFQDLYDRYSEQNFTTPGTPAEIFTTETVSNIEVQSESLDRILEPAPASPDRYYSSTRIAPLDGLVRNIVGGSNSNTHDLDADNDVLIRKLSSLIGVKLKLDVLDNQLEITVKLLAKDSNGSEVVISEDSDFVDIPNLG